MMLNEVLLNVILLSIKMLSVIMLSDVYHCVSYVVDLRLCNQILNVPNEKTNESFCLP